MKSLRNPSLPPRQRQIFQLHAYRLLSDPMAAARALIDPRLVGMFRRIMQGGHDCALCGRTLAFNAESLASPGIAGFVHGDLHHNGEHIDAIAVAACVACTLKLGDEGASRAIGQEFVDSCCGGGTVTLVQGGAA